MKYVLEVTKSITTIWCITTFYFGDWLIDCCLMPTFSSTSGKLLLLSTKKKWWKLVWFFFFFFYSFMRNMGCTQQYLKQCQWHSLSFQFTTKYKQLSTMQTVWMKIIYFNLFLIMVNKSFNMVNYGLCTIPALYCYK